jgi:hypothetical protein
MNRKNSKLIANLLENYFILNIQDLTVKILVKLKKHRYLIIYIKIILFKSGP